MVKDVGLACAAIAIFVAVVALIIAVGSFPVAVVLYFLYALLSKAFGPFPTTTFWFWWSVSYLLGWLLFFLKGGKKSDDA